ncbi:MAG: hypothetical protein LUB63_06875, partial [Oscillospiraceae bacterium]|nr:hypothetical protein [Oscillospiraceae bacterium]
IKNLPPSALADFIRASLNFPQLARGTVLPVPRVSIAIKAADWKRPKISSVVYVKYFGRSVNAMNENNTIVPGRGAATASLVLGILSIVFASFVMGIIGLVLAAHSKKAGFTGGVRTAGFVLSLIGLIFGVILVIIVTCVVGYRIIGYGI